MILRSKVSSIIISYEHVPRSPRCSRHWHFKQRLLVAWCGEREQQPFIRRLAGAGGTRRDGRRCTELLAEPGCGRRRTRPLEWH